LIWIKAWRANLPSFTAAERETCQMPPARSAEVKMDSDLREEILSILKASGEMTVATVRPDGYPQATTVNYVSDGFVIYFGCAAEPQKVQNIACNDKVSLTVTLPHFNWEDIRGLSIGGRAAPVTDAQEISRVSELMLRKFPQILRYALTGKKGVFLVRIIPEVVSVLDYRKEFGHTDLIKI
jgi:nitroimidazol reductase NimA-like FMN-containing flavoprotein (pyridoxamine 5'-phosphate oxidase superfamily)